MTATPVWSEPGGFVEDIDAILAPTGDSAPFLRCTGFFQAFRILAGVDTEVGQTAFHREVDMAVLSTLVRQDETGATQEAVMDEIRPIIASVAELYADRFVSNDAATGQVLDEGLEATLEVCSILRAQFQGATQ